MTGPEARRLLNLCDPHGDWRRHRGTHGDIVALETRPEPVYRQTHAIRVDSAGRRYGVAACTVACHELSAAFARAVIQLHRQTAA